MSAVKWIDIVSPRLREVHRIWCDLRGAHLLPHLRNYNMLLPAVRDRDSLCAVFPARESAPAFRSVGVHVTAWFPELHAGLRFSDIRSVMVRTAVTVPFHSVCSERQPDCRRGLIGSGSARLPYEELLLPFGDDRLRVCLVHAVFDVAATR